MKAKKFTRRLTAAFLACTLTFPASVQAAEYQGLNYSFVYDTDYYYKNNPDVATAMGYVPSLLYQHFVRYGVYEGRIASDNFNVYMYRKYNGDLNAVYGSNYENYFIHFLTYGKTEDRKINGYYYDGLDFSDVFDSTYYYNHNNDVAEAYGYDDALLWKHFITYGISEGRMASANFDVLAYRSLYKDLQEAFSDNLTAYYEHFIKYGKSEGRTAKISGTQYYNGMNLVYVYNKDYYLANNPDVKNALGDNDAAVLQHFINFGMKEGRIASTDFDVNVYKANYGDLYNAFKDDLEEYYFHYLRYGREEGRNATILTHEHSFAVVSQTASSCTSEGSVTYQCRTCKSSYTDYTPATDHNWQRISGNGSGVKTLTYRCNSCGNTYTAENPNYKPVSITCWGDSMTFGQCGNGTTYPGTLASLTGLTTYNLGISGETSEQIALREGGISMILTSAVTLPKGGSTSCELVSGFSGDTVYIDPVHSGSGDYSGYNFTTYFNGMCYINGQAYEVTYKNGRHYITDSYGVDCASDTIYIPAGTVIYPKAAIDRKDDILILEIGSNGGWNYDYDTLIAQYRAMLESAGCSRYIILGDTDDPGDSADPYQDEFDEGSGLEDTKWEAALREAFGSHFFNVRTYLLQNGLSDNGLTANDDDLERAAYGKISHQLKTNLDNTHLNANGYYSKGVGIYKKGRELGYW
jgi:hypothetical protein